MDTPEAQSSRPAHAALVVNTRSRTGERVFERAREQLVQLGVPIEGAYPMDDAGRIPETVQHLLDDGCDLLVLGAGDGTVSTVVDFLAEREVMLGLLPLGTANDFARTLQIPTGLTEACETIAAGKMVDIDLGLVGDNYFVNVASIGLSVAVTRALSARLKRRAGRLAYPLASLKAFFSHQTFSARLSFPNGDHPTTEVDQVLQVAIGNGRFYGGGNVVAPDASIDDHTLDVYVIQGGRHRDLIRIARSFRRGDFVHHDNVTHLTTRHLVVDTEPLLPLNIDGEIVTHSRQDFTVARNALHVLVPADSTAASLDH